MMYKIVEGLPANVENIVQQHITLGWRLNGPLFPRVADGYHLVVQGIVLEDSVAVPASTRPTHPIVEDCTADTPSLQDLIDRVSGSSRNASE